MRGATQLWHGHAPVWYGRVEKCGPLYQISNNVSRKAGVCTTFCLRRRLMLVHSPAFLGGTVLCPVQRASFLGVVRLALVQRTVFLDGRRQPTVQRPAFLDGIS